MNPYLVSSEAPSATQPTLLYMYVPVRFGTHHDTTEGAWLLMEAQEGSVRECEGLDVGESRRAERGSG